MVFLHNFNAKIEKNKFFLKKSPSLVSFVKHPYFSVDTATFLPKK